MTHFAQGWPTTWADVTAGLGVPTVRDELYWAQVETTAGVYSFPASFDAYMARLKQDDIAPLIIMSFANPLYDGGNTPYTAAGQAAFARYGAAILAHYGTQVEALEVWNEYNGGYCVGPATVDREGTYTAMLKAAYTRIKAVRPDVTVIGGATAGTVLPYWNKLIADGALAYLDVLSVHPYRYNQPPEGIENDILALQTLVRDNNKGVSKPIWVSEIGWEEQTAPLLVDDATLAKYVPRTYGLLLSAGVGRVYWYLLHDDYNEPMGLYRSDGTAKPAAAALSTFVSEIDGAPFTAKEKTPDNVYSLIFTRATGQQVRLLWSLAPRDVVLAGVTKAVDLFGNSLGTAGSFTLTDSPIYVEGAVSGVPGPASGDEVVVAASAVDFCGVQGYNGWTYGYIDGAGAYAEMPSYTSSDWYYYWTANYSYLEASETDMHPSLDGSTPVSVVRRWTSTQAGAVHLVGDFQGVAQGDGVGVQVLLNGKPLLARTLIGGTGGQPLASNFDLTATVAVGSTIDFVVDDGPAADMSYDATAFNVEIRVPYVPPAAAPTAAVTALALPASGTTLANSVSGFSGLQGGGGWSYGDFANESSTGFLAASAYSAGVWTGSVAGLILSASSQHPAIGTNGLDEVVAVRRWTSSLTGSVRVTGSFSMSRAGDGIGAAVLVNGKAVVARSLVGVSGPTLVKAFDFVTPVVPGTTIDFTVDPGPGRNATSDAPLVLATVTVP